MFSLSNNMWVYCVINCLTISFKWQYSTLSSVICTEYYYMYTYWWDVRRLNGNEINERSIAEIVDFPYHNSHTVRGRYPRTTMPDGLRSSVKYDRIITKIMYQRRLLHSYTIPDFVRLIVQLWLLSLHITE